MARIEEHPGWPWPMAVDIAWHLRPRELTTTITVHALDEPFPAVVGWHPWFRRQLDSGGPLELSMAASERLVRGTDHLPTGDAVPYDAGRRALRRRLPRAGRPSDGGVARCPGRRHRVRQ